MPVKILKPTPSAYQYPLLIKHLLSAPLNYAPQQEIIYRDLFRYTYKDFAQRLSGLANGLTALGVEPGHTVGVMDWDSHRYLECYFGIPMMGAVLHTVNVRLSPEQLVYTINHAEDDILLVNAEFLPLLESVRNQLTTIRKIVLLSDSPTPPQTSLTFDAEYEELVNRDKTQYDFPDFDENAIATTFYTTGTTGLPKGVFFSHRQLVMHTYGLISGLCGYQCQANISSGDVYMPITPMFHVHAWGMPFLMTTLGARQVYPGRYDPAMLLKLVVTEKVTFSHCVPTIMHMLVSSPAVKNIDFGGWKVVIGGSALPMGLCKAAMALGINIYTGYGMSETCPVLTLANLKPHMLSWDAEQQAKIRCRTGLNLPNVQLRLLDFEGNEVPHDGKSTGEVVVRSPWLTQGYFKEDQRSEELWDGGWLHTGDIGFIDEEGYLQITDRLKDVIKTGGEWVSSLELEDILSEHPAVSEVAVIGIKDQKWGERPMALVVLKADEQNKVSEEDLFAFFQKFVDEGKIAKYYVPSKITIVDALAKTSVGKLNKREMREQFDQ